MPRLLAFVPHPDDESYSFGGLIALAARAGWECQVVCCSSGEKGKRHDGGSADRQAVAETREAELEASCRALGALPPAFLHLPDGDFGAAPNGQFLFEALLRRFTPVLTLTLGADGAYGHPDHVRTHEWVRSAWSQQAEPSGALLFPVFPNGLFVPQWEKCIRMMGEPPNPPSWRIGSETWHYEVPIGAVRAEKLAAIASHRSQLPRAEPQGLFPGGIVDALLDVERFEDARGVRDEATAELLASFG